VPATVRLPVLGIALALLAAPSVTLADGSAGDADAAPAAISAEATASAGPLAPSEAPASSLADSPTVSPSPDAFAVDESELSPPASAPALPAVASAEPDATSVAPPPAAAIAPDPPAPAVSAAAPAASAAPPASQARCPEKGDAVAVFTTKRELWLCVDGKEAARYEVSLGQAGPGKRKQGDRRTPVGTYSLGPPRPSAKYGTFIPIAYPTPEQAAHGQTGGSVGIHGPPRKLPEPGYPTTAFDWTLGCVATGSDAEVEAIAAFVRSRQPVVVIR
jgi:hypothetical protein